MGYCTNRPAPRRGGLGYAGGGRYVEGLGGKKRVARLIREGATAAEAKRQDRTLKLAKNVAKLATGTRLQRTRYTALQSKVAAGTAKKKVVRAFTAFADQTPGTQAVIERVAEKRGGSDVVRDALAAAAEAAAAAAADREQRSADAAAAREATALQAAADREQRASDRELETRLQAEQRAADAERRAEDREIAQEQADYEREAAAAAATTATNGAAYYPTGGGGGGGGAPWIVAARQRDQAAAPTEAGGIGGILPLVAAGAAFLFLGS